MSFFFFSSRRRHTRYWRDWSSDVCSSDLGARIALWGLAFKPNTDDMRDAPSLTLIDDLVGAGARVVAHDPVAMPEASRRLNGRGELAESSYAALDGADALPVVTDWNEYRHPVFARLT